MYKNLLKILTFKNPNTPIKQLTNWIQNIINSTPTIALKMTPIETLTGVKPRTTYDLLTGQNIATTSTDRKKILDSIHETITKTDEKNILNTELKRKTKFRPLRIGQLVKIRLPPQKKIPNPLSKYTYRIYQASHEGSSFQLEDLKGGLLKRKFRAEELQRIGTTI